MRFANFALILCVYQLACSSGSPQSSSPATGGGGFSAGAGGSAGASGGVASSSGAGAGGNPSVTGGAGAGGSGTAEGGAGSSAGGVAGTSASMGGSAGTGQAQLPFGHPGAGVVHPQYEGFTLWLVEDFDRPLDLDHDLVWTWSDGGFETHRFRKEAITFGDGKMIFTLSNTPQPPGCSYSNTGNINEERARTSGELRSKHNWFRYGRYEVRLKAPSVKPNDAVTNGNYITSLFTYRQPACQEWREIDLEVTGDSPSHLGTNLITADGDCSFSDDKQQIQYFDLPGSFRSDFQTIGFEWLPDSIKFYYLDATGKPVQLRELTGPKVPKLSAKLMANLWTFNDSFAFGGPEGKNNVFPLRAEYDFIRFYRWNQDLDYPCSDMSTACLQATDLDLTANNACDGVPRTGDLASCKQCGDTVRFACTEACQ
jgi:hypothetical protein